MIGFFRSASPIMVQDNAIRRASPTPNNTIPGDQTSKVDEKVENLDSKKVNRIAYSTTKTRRLLQKLLGSYIEHECNSNVLFLT